MEEWVSAAEALKRAQAVMSLYAAPRAICSRAKAGLIKTKAKKLLWGKESLDDMEIPPDFWWAEGEAALEQNWSSGDFDTWIDQRIHVQAYGVVFSEAGVEALVGPARSARSKVPVAAANTGGRPPASWWDDLWIEMCRQIWVGDLKPDKQSEIESAMKEWTDSQGHDPADSTIRARARKLWAALNQPDEN